MEPGTYRVDDTDVEITNDSVVIKPRRESRYFFSKPTENGKAVVHYGITPGGDVVVRRASLVKSLYSSSDVSAVVDRFHRREDACPVCDTTSSMMKEVFKQKEMTKMAIGEIAFYLGSAAAGLGVPTGLQWVDEKVRAWREVTAETLPLWMRPSLVATPIIGGVSAYLGWYVVKGAATSKFLKVFSVVALAGSIYKFGHDLWARHTAGVSLLFPEAVAGGTATPYFKKKEELAKMRAEIEALKQGYRQQSPPVPFAEGVSEMPFGYTAYDYETGFGGFYDGSAKEVGRL